MRILLALLALAGLLLVAWPARADRQCLATSILGGTAKRVCVPCWYDICDRLQPPR